MSVYEMNILAAVCLLVGSLPVLAAWRRKWGSETNGAPVTARLLRESGFNGVGSWSDVEALANYLSLPQTDPGFQAATAWLRSRHGRDAKASAITEEDRAEFLALVEAMREVNCRAYGLRQRL